MSLAEALDALDAAIPDKPEPVLGCEYCYFDWELEALSGPRDEVPVGVMGQLAREVTDHWENFPGYHRRMTPRILRLLVEGAVPELDIVGDRLRQAGWQQWPAPERAAVARVCEEWWDATLAAYPSSPEAGEVLEFLVAATGHVERWLDTWTQAPRGAADDHLAEVCIAFMHRLAGDRVLLGFYDDYDVTDPLVDWLRNYGRERLTAAGRDTYPVDLLLAIPSGPSADASRRPGEEPGGVAVVVDPVADVLVAELAEQLQARLVGRVQRRVHLGETQGGEAVLGDHLGHLAAQATTPHGGA